MFPDRLQRLTERLANYPWWQVAIEIGLIWVVVFVVFRFVQGTRAAGALKGVLFIIILATLVVRILGQAETFQRIKFLYDTFLTLLAITLIVVFQPELRRGLIRLGETQLLRRSHRGTVDVIDSIVDAAAYLGKASFGAIIVIQRENPLKGLVEGGTPVHAQLSARLLQTLFFPGSALHDLAVIVRGGELVAAGVQLPLAEPEDMPDPSLGSRHRAAVGLSKECDALVVVVSEETGMISLADRGRLDRGLSPDELRERLQKKLRGRATVIVAENVASQVNGDSTAVGLPAIDGRELSGDAPSDSGVRPALRITDQTPPPAAVVSPRKQRGARRR
ncbi:MAG: TIGR00159 family protein [Phycisphaerales bacterium]|nr:TIGR00159 family protein [Phycisphaerales bacterium]